LTDFSKALASNFEVANASGNDFAAHLYTNIGSGVTGFIAANSTDPVPVQTAAVPEPASITVGGTGILAAFALAWYRRKLTATRLAGKA
jgi:hypothetical protein